MTVTGGDAPNEETRVDREPPEFPHVPGTGDPAPGTGIDQPSAPLFSRPAEMTTPPPGGPPVTTAPVSAGGGSTRWRWAAALVATLLVVAVIGGILVFAGPGAGTPSTASLYAPADTAIYLELRRDLPGDQRDRLAQFMGHFPGFADPAAFEQKLDETLDQMLETSGSGLDWQADVEPWFGGQVAFFTSTLTPTQGTPPSLSIVLTVTDRARLDALIQRLLDGTDASQQGHEGQTIWTVTGGPDNQRLSFVVTDEVLLLGLRVEDVKQALDVRADRTPGLADDEFFLAQLAELHADRLATLYADGRGLANSMRDQLGSAFPPGSPVEDLLEATAVRVLGELRAEGDHLALTTRTQPPPVAGLPPLPANTTTSLAESVSAETIFYAESRQVGQAIGYLIDQLLATVEQSGTPLELTAIEQLLGTSPRDFFDFLQDVAIAAAYDEGGLEAGIIATVDDEAVARQRVDRLLQTIRPLAAFGGGITIEEQEHGAATITVIRLGGLVGDDAPVSSVALTVSGGRLYLGLDDFVVNALDRSVESSLASRPEYSAALQAGGTSNAGLMFLDIAALRGLAESVVPERERAFYEQEYQPFIEPLSHIAVVNSTDGEMTVTHVFLYVE